ISDNKLTTQYIPAERNLISLFNKSLTTLLVAEVPLPKFLLHFSSEFEKAGNELKELEFLNVKYVNGDGLDRHKVYFNDKDYLPLEFSSSGIQSALPLYLTVKYFANRHNSIIIEEPEQNLFPKAQKETIEYIIEHITDENRLFMMTHSPYVLTALNNLILANDVKNQKGVEAIKNIVEEKHCVNFDDVNAYTIIDGKSIDIMDREDRLIGINLIDSISDEVNNNFDKLLSKLD
ncbi:ATP-binding protein, partial [Sulfurovum sp. bin170]|uniref:AAA family ATPase n=1 Tax=Sulfurovum sp. bin170 TaxID=2695268 RepID=UPI0013DF1213